ncbi:SseB family protein [Kibdelosporangium philippinense]|uniref:SseB family protein n=1 Tax=Kibdelosporangium philippinense TaxID=211113 RepID=A0ABS8ZHR5_9PSEU|nr:SseB family protein [Kibdelosporangium philippinense]MCE7007358.1 SseB family protein [Kibdelosporangium philippinense]
MVEDRDEELSIVRVAMAVRHRSLPPAAFDAAFADATVYVRRTPGDRPGVMVSSIPGKGQWVLAFSTLERFAAFGQDKPWLSTTGRDLLTQLRPGIGVLFDLGEDHGLPLLPQRDGPATFAGADVPEPNGAGCGQRSGGGQDA